MTDKVRRTVLYLFALTVACGLVGWFMGLDLEALLPLIGPQTAALGLAEASNVGKRATTKADVIEAHARVNGSQ